MRGVPHGVYDTQVVVLANARVTKHMSERQRSRCSVLRLAIEGQVVALHSPRLDNEYVKHLQGRQLNDIVQAFIRTVDTYGKSNYRPLEHHERSILRDCRFPAHDEHLVKTAKGVADAAIVADEGPALASATCVKNGLGLAILSPRDALAHWAHS